MNQSEAAPERSERSERVGKQEPHGVLYVGMDLGTSRTAIACSNGVRESVASVVGYPKDVVSRKHLRREVIVGDEAYEHRLSLDFHRPLAQGVIRGSDDGEDPAALRAAKDLVRHAVGLARARADELVYGVIGCPAQASIRNRQAILEAAREVFDSVMICSEPFAVAYGLDRLSDVLVIDIGAGTTDLCRMHGTMPEAGDQVTLPFAGDSIDEALLQGIRRRHPEAQVNLNMVRRWKERWGTVAEETEPIVVEAPVGGKPTPIDITEEMKEACRTIVPPIVRGLQELVASFDPEFQDRLKNNVLLGGGGSQIAGLGDAIEREMRERLGGGRVDTVEEPVYAGANGALKIAHDMPEEFWEKLR